MPRAENQNRPNGVASGGWLCEWSAGEEGRELRADLLVRRVPNVLRGEDGLHLAPQPIFAKWPRNAYVLKTGEKCILR